MKNKMAMPLTRFYYEDLTDAAPRLDQVFEDIDTEQANDHEKKLIELGIDFIRVDL